MALAERDRRALMIFGAIVVVALAAYFLVLKPKGGEEPAAAGSSSGPFTTGPLETTAPSVGPSKSPPVTPRTSPPPSGVPLGGKDPFSPIVNPSGGGGPSSTTGGGGTSGPGTSTPSTTGPGTSPTGTGTPSTTGPGTSPTSTGSPTHSVEPPASPSGPGHGTSTHVDGHTVTLIDIFTRDGVEKAQVQVDATAYTVSEGDTFSDGFRLESITGTCATFSQGSQEFILCENPQK